MTRVRSCSNPSPANGGSECSGAERENKTCEGTGCPGILFYHMTPLLFSGSRRVIKRVI